MNDDTLEQVVTWIKSRFFGKYRGKVSSNLDPTGRGRLEVTIPAVLGDTAVWAMPCVPYAGAGVGFASLPEADAGVWVEFESGDPSYPIWTGCFWADGQMPAEVPMATPDKVKVWKTTNLTVQLDELTGKVLVTSSSGGQLEVGAKVASQVGTGGAVSASHEITSSGVASNAGPARSVDLSSAGLSVNGGSLEVS